jgi:tricorn protease
VNRTLFLFAVGFVCTGNLAAREPIRLANNPALSPDGKTLAFDYAGDIWTISSAGGLARPLTQNPAKDSQPKFSPDGKEIAFISDRDGTPQVYLMPAAGGSPKQITFHTAGFTLHEWTPDGNHVLVSAMRDHAWSRRQPERFYLVNVLERKGEQLLFNDYGSSGTMSADGKKLLFTREGPEWWRKGYVGSAAAQVWCYDLERKQFEPILMEPLDHRWPLWKPDGKGIYFCTNTKNGFVLQEMDLEPRPVTTRLERSPVAAKTVAAFPDDSVVFPCISRDGSTLVFRHLFDLYRVEPGKNGPVKIEIWRDDDRAAERLERRTLTQARAVAFTGDGLEVAFTAGGDLWVMDTELREPKRVTNTPEEERAPVFAPDGQSILFVSDAGGKTDIWRATRGDAKKPWFLNNSFKRERVTTDGAAKSELKFSPDGSKLAYICGRGDLWVADADGSNAKRVIESWDAPAYDWSPDAKWLVYAVHDADFNRDIWIMPLDGSRPPFNLSRHPFNEDDPVWSPDGRLIAYVGARDDKNSTDIHFVYLRAEDDQKNNRDRAIEKALEKLRKGQSPKAGPKLLGDAEPPELVPEPRVKDAAKSDKKETGSKKRVPEVVIDFEGIHERIRRVPTPNSSESNLIWSPDSKKLAFTATVEGQAGTYTIELPENLRPTLLSTQTGTQARWLKSGQIVWLSGGLPGSISGTPSAAPATTTSAPTPKGPGRRVGGPGGSAGDAPAPAGAYRFTAFQESDVAKRHQAAFDLCWRTMRDNWYDEKMGNRDWNAIRAKYLPVAETTDQDALATVVQLMLGELNGSHLGFFAGSMTLPGRRPGSPPDEPTPGDRKWSAVTANLGVRFDEFYPGPGLKVRDVLPDGPADQKRSQIRPGELVFAVDGVAVDRSKDLTDVLNGHPSRDILLKVKDTGGTEREVIIRPITFTAARNLVYKKWLNDNRAMVDKLSNGTLGYLHVRAMDMPSFHKFEEELYDAGAGKAGLVIDVRENGGGSTTDHLLTALTQPRHAIAVPRGGGPGYPQDRTVYATWNKPIVVLCNQNSFSNAEIFSHAIKTLKRGHLVGVPTAGGVISTGGTAIMDVGFLRMPTRGWYVLDTGEDMELNGAVPHFNVWPAPGDMPKGKDDQIEKAVQVLLADVKEFNSRPVPKLKKATDR